jgi:hypothetical protein
MVGGVNGHSTHVPRTVRESNTFEMQARDLGYSDRDLDRILDPLKWALALIPYAFFNVPNTRLCAIDYKATRLNLHLRIWYMYDAECVDLLGIERI